MQQQPFHQIALPVTLPDDETFACYVPGDNQTVFSQLNDFIAESGDKLNQAFIFGGKSSGKSHLLYASCIAAQERGIPNILLAMDQLVNYGVDVLSDLEHYDLVCIDDVHLVAGIPEWERALFNFYNLFNEAGKRLFISATDKPESCGFQLPDLTSRLQWGVSFYLKELGDDEKVEALILRARLRGLEMSDDAARFLLHRISRDMSSLMLSLDQLDRASIAMQRRITIPFIKDVLSL